MDTEALWQQSRFVAQKEEPDVTRQGWFMQAKTRMENTIFHIPMYRIY